MCRIDIEMLLAQFTSLTESIDKLEAVVVRVSESDPYKKVNDALVSFRGISTITAMTLISELGDIRRFPHPKQLTAYCGLDIAEYSSGGKQKGYHQNRE